jgi:hypothetical protein
VVLVSPLRSGVSLLVRDLDELNAEGGGPPHSAPQTGPSVPPPHTSTQNPAAGPTWTGPRQVLPQRHSPPWAAPELGSPFEAVQDPVRARRSQPWTYEGLFQGSATPTDPLNH